LHHLARLAMPAPGASSDQTPSLQIDVDPGYQGTSTKMAFMALRIVLTNHAPSALHALAAVPAVFTDVAPSALLALAAALLCSQTSHPPHPLHLLRRPCLQGREGIAAALESTRHQCDFERSTKKRLRGGCGWCECQRGC